MMSGLEMMLCSRPPKLQLRESQKAPHQLVPVEAAEAGHQAAPADPAPIDQGEAELEDGAGLPKGTGEGMMMRARTSMRG